MHALPAAPAPEPRRQLLVATALGSAAVITLVGGMTALFVRFRESALAQAKGVWRPAGVKIPQVAANVMMLAFIGILVFAQWAAYAAKRKDRAHTALALGLNALLGIAVVNAQAFVYHQTHLALKGGTYQTFFYAMTGTMVALLIAGIVFSIVAAFRFLGGRVSDHEVVAANALYWYAVTAAFFAVWFVVYVRK
jgi:heme/copper-type cytochrome/quinol oxidase subunit 3